MTATDEPLLAHLPQSKTDLEGTWRMRAFEAVGARTVVDTELTWAVDGEELVIRRQGVAERPPGAIGYSLIALTEPGAVNFVVRHDNGRHQTLPGVYEVHGDTLTVCLALRGGRPASYAAKGTVVVYTFDRMSDSAE